MTEREQAVIDDALREARCEALEGAARLCEKLAHSCLERRNEDVLHDAAAAIRKLAKEPTP